MQTPGLPASQPASANRSAAKSVFEKHSHTGEHFGEVMHRALTSDDQANPQAAPKSHHSPSADNLTAKNQDPPDKTGGANKKHATAGRKSEHSTVPTPFLGLTTVSLPSPTVPLSTPSPTPNLSTPNLSTLNLSTLDADKSSKGKMDPISTATTKTDVSDAKPAETAPTDEPIDDHSAAKSVVTPLYPKMLETTHPVNRARKTPLPTKITEKPEEIDSSAKKQPTASPANDSSTTETAIAFSYPKMSESTDSADIAQKTAPPTQAMEDPKKADLLPTRQQTAPTTTVTEQLTAAVESVVATDAPTDLAISATPDDPGPQLGQISHVKAGHEPQAASSAIPHGTSAAKQDVTMKKAEKTQKVAGLTEQDLPGNTATGSEELPEGQKLSVKAAAHGEKPESTTIELPTRISTSVESPAPTVTAAAPAPAPAVDSRVLERTHDIVALHAMRLTDTGADSLRVVVKPGGGIQLSLELRQSARGIEVSAELHKGDFQHLNQHWSDLQQRLEARGVRVSSLTTAENYTGGQHFNQSKQQSSNQDPLYAGAFAEFALAGSMTEAPGARAARATAYRGWETWA
jgi:hypothetical protein